MSPHLPRYALPTVLLQTTAMTSRSRSRLTKSKHKYKKKNNNNTSTARREGQNSLTVGRNGRKYENKHSHAIQYFPSATGGCVFLFYTPNYFFTRHWRLAGVNFTPCAQPMQSFSHAQQSLILCHSQSKHETQEEHVPSQAQV